jgi:hypothetical protein
VTRHQLTRVALNAVKPGESAALFAARGLVPPPSDAPPSRGNLRRLVAAEPDPAQRAAVLARRPSTAYASQNPGGCTRDRAGRRQSPARAQGQIEIPLEDVTGIATASIAIPLRPAFVIAITLVGICLLVA